MSPIEISLRELEYLIAAADLGHFGRAAERCGVSQPALSAQIRKLEDTLGIVLFERAQRKVSVTAAAKPIIAQARRTLAEARRIRELAASASGELRGEVNIWSIATLGPYLIPHILRPLCARFPHANFFFGEGFTADILSKLRSGEVDAAFMSLPIPRDGFAVRDLFFEPFAVIFPCGHALGRLRRVGLNSLPGEGLLLLEEGHCLRDQALHLCGSASRIVRNIATLETIRHLVAAQAGYSIFPALAVRDDPALRGLVGYAPLADKRAGRLIGLVWRESDPRAAQFHAMAELVRSTPHIRDRTKPVDDVGGARRGPLSSSPAARER
jgi:LysR family hydrogen peroxide-inducible transcriptional activator